MFTLIIGLMYCLLLFIVLFLCKLFGLTISWLMVFLLPIFTTILVFAVTVGPLVLLVLMLGAIAK